MRRLNSSAVGIGAAAGVGGSLLLGILFRVFALRPEADRLWRYLLVSYAAGAAVDLLTGAVAGALARYRGALHGLVAGVLATLASWLIGWGLTLWHYRDDATVPIALWQYLRAVLPAGLAGLVLAAVAGAVAARIAARPR